MFQKMITSNNGGGGRGGLKSVSEGKFSFYAVSTSGYTGDYQYWAAY